MLIYDRNGNLLADIGDQGDHRIVVPLTYISPNVINATIAIEDHSFYSNNGVDFGAVLRAALADYAQSRHQAGWQHDQPAAGQAAVHRPESR